MNVQISNCCGGKVKVTGGVYVCRDCNEPCDLAIDEEDADIHPLFS